MTQHGCKAFRREHSRSKALLEGSCPSVTSSMISKEEELSLVPLHNKKSIHPALTMAPWLGINLKFFSNHAFRWNYGVSSSDLPRRNFSGQKYTLLITQTNNSAWLLHLYIQDRHGIGIMLLRAAMAAYYRTMLAYIRTNELLKCLDVWCGELLLESIKFLGLNL